jgi:hypothetical protein
MMEVDPRLRRWMLIRCSVRDYFICDFMDQLLASKK